MLKVSYDCRNNSSLVLQYPNGFIPDYYPKTFPEGFVEVWKAVKVYDRSNSKQKQVYYKNKYVCSCAAEEIDKYKTYIVEHILDGFSIDGIKENLKY